MLVIGARRVLRVACFFHIASRPLHMSNRGGKFTRGSGRGGSYRRGGGRGGSGWGSRSNSDRETSTPSTELGRYLLSLSDKSYGAYKSLQGDQGWEICGGDMIFEKVQSDPYAPPSLVSFCLSQKKAKYPDFCHSSVERQIATEDFLSRVFSQLAKDESNVHIQRPSQCVIQRNSVLLTPEQLEVRFSIQLPASNGRRIYGQQAMKIIETSVVSILHGLYFQAIQADELQQHIHTYLDQLELRALMKSHGLLAFIADGSVLPRKSGDSDLPLSTEIAVPFASPAHLKKTFTLPHRGEISGMGIAEGITLIVGGGFHGKSTLMDAIQKGVYNHVAGDGREFVLAEESAVSIQAEDGRNVEQVDISPFINNIPGGLQTTKFTSTLASGSTSQATNIMEALEVGSRVLLIDEDRTATNFMCRDRFMSELISSDKEPIFPFISKAQAMYKEHGVSTILVIGGLGEYFAIADRVLMMDNYRCLDVTEKAKAIIAKDDGSKLEISDQFGAITPRGVSHSTWYAFAKEKVKSHGSRSITVGHQGEIDLGGVPFQEEGQLRLITFILQHMARKKYNKPPTMKELADTYGKMMNQDRSFDCFTPYKTGSLTAVRPFELMATLNRYRNLKIQ